MKTITVTAILTMLALVTKAQNIVDKTDEFTGKKTKAAIVFFGKKVFGAPILGASTPSLTFTNVGDKKVMFFSFPGFSTQLTPSSAKEEINVKTCSLLMKMETDSVLRFKADTTGSFLMHNGLTYTVGITTYLNDAQLNYLMNNKIKIFRLGVNGDMGTDIELLTDKNRREIQKSAMFMLGLQEVHDQE